MTAPAPASRSERTWFVPAVVALGGAALVARPLAYGSMAATALVGLAGAVAPTPRRPAEPRPPVYSATVPWRAGRWATVTLAGAAVFWLGRAVGSGVGVRVTALGVVALVVAGVAEEALFRRLLFGWLEPIGAAVAVVGAAGAFALVHIPAYGPAVFWIDLAAGVILGWQRWSSGGWSSPAATHVLANLLQMG